MMPGSSTHVDPSPSGRASAGKTTIRITNDGVNPKSVTGANGAAPIQIYVHGRISRAHARLGDFQKECTEKQLPCCRMCKVSGMIHDVSGSWACSCLRGVLRVRLQMRAEIDGEESKTLGKGKPNDKTFKQILLAGPHYEGWCKHHANWYPHLHYVKWCEEKEGFGAQFGS